jgi:hypothetical protein
MTRDIVIPFRYCDDHADRYLRWTLRSFEQSLLNVGRVVIVGDIPYWLKTRSAFVAAVPYAHYHKHKFQNLATALMTAIRDADMHGKFLYSGDDIFHLAPTDAAKVQYFRRRRAIRTAAEYWSNYDPAKDGERGYVQMMINTRNALDAHGYPIVEFEGHATRPIDADCAEEAARVFADATGDVQVEPSCVFGNIALKHDHDIPQADRKDWKIRTMREFDAVMAERDSTYCFSIHPCMMQQPDFINAMDALFPKKSRFELW